MLLSSILSRLRFCRTEAGLVTGKEVSNFMNRGQHRRANSVVSMLKRKPVYLSIVGLATIATVGMNLHSKTSYAAPTLATWGSGAPPTTWGGTPQQNGSISGGKTLYPQQGSTELPPNWQGVGSLGPAYPAEGKMFFDSYGKLQGPGGTGGPVPAYLEHYDVTYANNSTQPIKKNDGFETIQASMIDPYISNIDGYQGSGGTQESEFDTFLYNEALTDAAIWSPHKNGNNSNTVYDLPNLIQDAGGAFSGRYLGPTNYSGPLYYWTYAPQAQVKLAPGQNITPGGTVKFYGLAAIQSYHAKYHWEYAQVVDSNGTVVVPMSKINFAGKTPYGLGTGANGSGVYLNPNSPQSTQQFQEVNGGNPNPPSVAPQWYDYADGTYEGSNWGQTSGATPDTFTAPTTPGTYTIQFYSADYYNRVSKMATATFTVGKSSGAGITLTPNPTGSSHKVGTSVQLTATVTTPPPKGDQWEIVIEDNGGSGSTISGGSAVSSATSPTTFSVTVNSSTPLSNENYVAYLYDLTNNANDETSNTVTESWTNGNGGGGGGGGGGLCPAPYDSNEFWQSNGNGNETFYWTYNVPYPKYNRKGHFIGCGDTKTQMHQYYPATENQGQISGLSYDPGSPGNMWLPESASLWGGDSFWAPLRNAHGWDGWEKGGPSASQVSGTYFVNGQQYHTYGPGEGSTPWAWARPDSGFGFRMLWTGSPHSLPTSGTVTYTMRNPDGSSTSWTEPLVINTGTLHTQGTSMLGLNQPPPFANEEFSAWAQIPKTMSNHELAAWSLSSNPSTALYSGAKISVAITFGTQNAGSINVNVPTMIALFNYPAWYFTHIKSTTIVGKTY